MNMSVRGAGRVAAVIATGVIGRSWIIAFARAGWNVRAWDLDRGTRDRAVAWARDGLESSAGSVTACATLEEALDGVEFVQESGPEQIDAKRAIYAQLDRAAAPDVILASSTSALDMTEIVRGAAGPLAGAARCVTAHPVNPPHVVPVVEILGGEQTSRETIDRAFAVMKEIGQTPVLLNRYVPGFLLNRMQAALVREAMDLLRSGVADADAIDAVIRDGLGLRWTLLGPFGVANTNADGGSREYFTRYGPSFLRLMDDLGPTPAFDATLIEQIGAGTDAMENGATRADIRAWRDRMVLAIRKLKQEDPHP